MRLSAHRVEWQKNKLYCSLLTKKADDHNNGTIARNHRAAFRTVFPQGVATALVAIDTAKDPKIYTPDKERQRKTRVHPHPGFSLAKRRVC